MDLNQEITNASPITTNPQSSSPVSLRLIILAVIILVVIVTLAWAYISSGSKARDRIRVSDIQLITKFLADYKNNVGTYPASANGQPVGWETYLQSYPKPPSPESNCSVDQNNYKYLPLNDRTSYQLSFCLGRSTSGFKAGLNLIQP